MRSGRAIAVVLTLVVHGPAHAQEELPRWDVDPRPALEIGVADALDAEMFVRATDAVLLESGGVAVLDAGGGRVRVFDDSGHPVGGFGQTGEGPGEWIAPLAIETIGDTLVAWDSRRGILSRWSQDGIFLEERRVPHHRTFHEGSLLPDGSLIIPRYAEDGDRPPAGSRYRAYADLLLYAKGEIRDLGPFPFEEMVVGSPVQPA